MDDDSFLAVITLVGLAILAVVIGLPGRAIARHYDVKSCNVFQKETGYQTKFVDYHFFHWDCMAQTQTGKWVSSNNIREID